MNIRKILRNPSLLISHAYLAGNEVSDTTDNLKFDVVNPSDGDVITSLPDLGAKETATAISAAHDAQKLWAKRTANERSGVLRRLHGLMLQNLDDLAAILTAEMGKPFEEAKGEILYGAGYVDWFADEARRVYGDVIPGHGQDKRIITLKQPIGVVASITPWNFPNAMIARKLAPAIGVGCSFVAKPSELTPLSALALAKLCYDAGVPRDLVSIITTTRSSEVGRELCENNRVRKITFTGSTPVGRTLIKQSADQVMRTSMELGGNAPFIVFDDADLDAAIDGLMKAKFGNNGQTCISANRIFVQNGVFEKFSEKFAEKVGQLRVGDGFTDGVVLGPMINDKAVEKVTSHISDAVSRGARVLVGGKPHALGSTFFEPTVLADVNDTMKFATEETFGPLAPLYRFEDEEDVIEKANSTIFGLGSYFYASDLARVWRVAEALEFGMVAVNTSELSNPAAPFGGVKQSGIGREGSKYGCDDYLEIKYVRMGGF